MLRIIPQTVSDERLLDIMLNAYLPRVIHYPLSEVYRASAHAGFSQEFKDGSNDSDRQARRTMVDTIFR